MWTACSFTESNMWYFDWYNGGSGHVFDNLTRMPRDCAYFAHRKQLMFWTATWTVLRRHAVVINRQIWKVSTLLLLLAFLLQCFGWLLLDYLHLFIKIYTEWGIVLCVSSIGVRPKLFTMKRGDKICIEMVLSSPLLLTLLYLFKRCPRVETWRTIIYNTYSVHLKVFSISRVMQ